MPSFAGNQQQDAHEFTRFLLERLRSEFVRGDMLAEKARRAASLSLSAGAKDPLHRNVTPRGREHGEEGGVMHELGIPNPIRRSRSARRPARGREVDGLAGLHLAQRRVPGTRLRARTHRAGRRPRRPSPRGSRRRRCGARRGGGGGRGGRVHDCLALGRGAAQARVLVPPLQVAAQGGGATRPGRLRTRCPAFPWMGAGFRARPCPARRRRRSWRRRRVCARPAPD